MKREKLEFVPVGKRTRLQCGLREKELSERNKKVWLAARSKHRKVYANENILDIEDDSDGEDVKVVSEAEYLRHQFLHEYKGSSPDSADLVGEISNPLRICFDENENDKDNEDGFEGCTPLMEVEDIQFSGMKPGSEATGGVGDGNRSVDQEDGNMKLFEMLLEKKQSCDATISLCSKVIAEYQKFANEVGQEKVRSPLLIGPKRGSGVPGQEDLAANIPQTQAFWLKYESRMSRLQKKIFSS